MCGPMSIFDERLSICSDPARAYPKCGVMLPPTPTPPIPNPDPPTPPIPPPDPPTPPIPTPDPPTPPIPNPDDPRPRPPFNIDCSNEKLHSYPYDCSRFYQCVQEGNKDKIYVFSCAAGLHFNETLSECVLESESTCNISPSNATLLNGNFDLDCGTDDLHRYPLNCNYFYQCFKDGTTNTIFVYSCADDLVFDEPTNSCKKPNETSSCGVSEVIRNTPFPAGQTISINQLSKFTKYHEDVNSPLHEIPKPFNWKATPL